MTAISIRTVLRANAASCLVFGLIFAVAPGAVAAFVGDPPALLVRIVGVGLILNATHLLIAAHRPILRRTEIGHFVIGDAAWAVATLALIATGTWITAPAGIAASLVVAAMVAAFGWLQWTHLNAGSSGETQPQA